MKIIQFTPNFLNQRPKNGRRDGEADFASHLAATPPGTAEPPGRAEPPGTAEPLVSIENQRALRLPPAADLGQAGRLLNSLDNAIRTATPEILTRLHDLEGLICIYRKTADS